MLPYLFSLDAETLVEEVRRFGLTEYEARCYVFLSKLGPSHPRKIASEASIPYPNAYEALDRLRAKGWVELVRKRPATYRARNPRAVRQELQAKFNETFEALESTYRNVPIQEAELVYTLRSKDRVLSKVLELLREAESSVILVAPAENISEPRIVDSLRKVAKGPAKIRVISDREAFSVLPKGVEMRTSNLVALDLLVDQRTALISLPDYSACGWTDSPEVASHFMQFLELMWNAAEE